MQGVSDRILAFCVLKKERQFIAEFGMDCLFD